MTIITLALPRLALGGEYLRPLLAAINLARVSAESLRHFSGSAHSRPHFGGKFTTFTPFIPRGFAFFRGTYPSPVFDGKFVNLTFFTQIKVRSRMESGPIGPIV